MKSHKSLFIMPRRAYWYLMREILPYYALSLLFTTSIILVSELARFSELFVKRNVPLNITMTLLLGVIINILVLTVPISLLTGTMIGFSRLSADNEIISLIATGMSRRNLFAPILSLSIGAFLLMSFLTLKGIPYATQIIYDIQTQLMVQSIRTQVKPGVFDTRFANYMLYVEEINRKTDQWFGILLSTYSDNNQTLITGKRGILEIGDEYESSILHVFDGTIHRLEKGSNQESIYHMENFSSYHVRVDAKQKEVNQHKIQDNQSRWVKQASIKELLGFNKKNKKQYIKAIIESQKRLLLPLSCLLFAPFALLLGLPNSGITPVKGFFFQLRYHRDITAYYSSVRNWRYRKLLTHS